MMKSIKTLLIPLIVVICGVAYFINSVNIHDNVHISELKFPCAMLIILILIIVINKIDKKKMYTDIKPYNDIDNVLLPAEIAEYVIDNKINNNNMIMSLLLDLKIRRNIDFINNTKIVLLNKDNLCNYEIDLIDSIFIDSNEIDLNNLNSYFINSNKKSKNFFKNLEHIKTAIKNATYSMNIYDSSIRNALNIIQCFILFICTNIILNIMSYPSHSGFEEYWFVYFFVYILYAISHKNNESIIPIFLNNTSSINKYKYIKKICIRIIFAIFIIGTIIQNGLACLDLIIYLLNFIIIFNLCNANVLTAYGIQEYNKILGLKKYIEDFSILEEKDSLDVTLWEKYLVYATAFGIPDKIIHKISEHSMNLNIFLQLLNNLLKIN